MPTASTTPSRTASILAASLFCSLAVAQAPERDDQAGPRVPAAPAVSALPFHREAGRVFLDAEADGTIWARGDDWKASFDHTGATFVPFLGSQRPRNYPMQLHLQGAHVGATPLPIEWTAPAHSVGERIEIARGSLVEAYELRPEHIEQRFVFAQPLAGGALVVDIQVTTELVGSRDRNGGHSFKNEFGGVRIGRAIAFDSRHQQVEVESLLDGDHLRLTVPAAFVAAATYPLTIDPVVQTFSLSATNPTNLDRQSPDCAYVGTYDGLYAAVYEEVYSATDHDVYLQPYGRDGAAQPGLYIDYTTQFWATPQIASHRGASQFLVVAARGTTISTTQIWARTVDYSVSGGSTVLTVGTAFPVQGFGNGKNPDVGGDPNPSPPTPGNYCVTWEGQIDGELYYNIVHTDGSLLSTNGLWLDAGPEFVSNPKVSKSCGVGAYNTRQWMIVWQKRYSPTDEDIYGSVINIDGTVNTLEFLVDYSSMSDSNPEVSSLTDLINGLERFVVVYQRAVPPVGVIAPGHDDIMGQLFTGTSSQSGPISLTALLATPGLNNQRHPSVDTDGTRFAIGFSEAPSIFAIDMVPYLATVHITSSDSLGVTSYPEATNAYGGPDDHVRVTSERSGGTFTPRYMSVWDVGAIPPTTPSEGVNGAFYFGHSNLVPSAYFNNSLPGCGGLIMTPSGLPALANTFYLDLTGVQGLPFLLFGTAIPPISLCSGCQLGVDPTTMIVNFGANLTITVPANSSLIDVQFGTQGLDLLATGGCSAPVDFTLSNRIIVTIL